MVPEQDRELARLHRDLDAAAARMVELERERDMARGESAQAKRDLEAWANRAKEAALQLNNVRRAMDGVPLHAPACAEAVAVVALRDEAAGLRDALAAEQRAARALADEVAAHKAADGEAGEAESPSCPLYPDDAMAACGDAVMGRKPVPEEVCSEAEACHGVLVAKAPALVQLALLARPG